MIQLYQQSRFSIVDLLMIFTIGEKITQRINYIIHLIIIIRTLTCRFVYLCQKFDLQNATGVDTPYFERQADLTCLRTTVDKLDKLDVDKLEAVTVDLKELSDTVEKEVLNQRKNLMPFRLLILEIQFKKLTMTQKLLKLERKYLLIMITNISVYKTLTNSRQKIFLKN